MTRLDGYWTTNEDWYHFDENGMPVINDDAPPEAKESYENYRKQSKNNPAL